ncbi:chitin synthase chs-2-like [Pollicipes pollicipes]|uniref:chitin synthase chs-2-like n=1 Tax=Pollicipes pollicipes TaxID=41117 RepID=UPI001884DAA8|nr:chitin synthase chs-2-like [Pollicipes pollicipes]
MPELKKWDVFRVIPPDNDSGSAADQRCLDITIKIVKVIVYIITFGIVLASGVIAKGTTLFMTSQLKQHKSLEYCNKRIGLDKTWRVELPDVEKVAWVWCLFFCFITPEAGTWIRSTRMCIFKSIRRPEFSHFLVVVLFETLHTIGLALLVFFVLPDLDAVKGVMLTNCVCIVPGVLGMLSRTNRESRRFLKTVCDIAAILGQATGFIVWPIIEYQKGNTKACWAIPLAVVLTSLGWWENYVDRKSKIGIVQYLGTIKEKMKKTRYWVYLFASLWKILVFFACMLFFMFLRLDNVGDLFTKFTDSFNQHKIFVNETSRALLGTATDTADFAKLFTDTKTIFSDGNTAIYVCLIQIFAAYSAYIFGKFACKICIQGFSFAFPVNLTIPVTLSLLLMGCGLRSGDACFLRDTIPGYLFFECPRGDYIKDFIAGEHVWIWVLWLFSQTWITLHIWTPHCERLATTEKLFVTPMYNSLLIDQSLGMNRRQDDAPERLESDSRAADPDDPDGTQHYETISIHTDSSQTANVRATDHITRIIACATMWHETRDEMMDMLKSVLRMDEDQSAMKVAQEYLKVRDKDYYEFETHIFFDDAFEMSDEDEDEQVANRFVRMLVECIDEAASHVHQIPIRLRPPTKIPTPYGGRLTWTLPGKTKLIAHLKNKMLIRHRKRWSQVMYMYYLLGYRLMELDISVERKEIMADNTYLLTLDGDIDFQPSAVKLLVDLMKKNRNLGAACGRIHPVGSGPMVWYQLFEYAIGHWLQKATEHMIGCVLCSPGCFSLFRAKGLMDDNVMKKYTLTSHQARHYVQYDQGEDRWLCTLLLQRGYRVDYSAASDAYTHCPEGFSEFYNQRRRWVPSTIANIMDLLMDYRNTIKINDNISMPYIMYQSFLMAGTILGPGTIFLMLVGAFVAAFRIDNWTSFQYNIYPILVFMLVCFTMKSNIQLLVAQILSAAYALIMMAVIVGTTLQLYEDGPGSPSFIFLIATILSMVIAAVLHPQEFKCIFPGFIYLLSIPSMYLLLILYSLTNLNNVTWGTREVLAKKTKKELEEERKALEEAKKRPDGILGYLYSTKSADQDGSIEFNFANLFRIMCCTYPKQIDEREQLKRIADSLDALNRRMDLVEGGHHHGRRCSFSRSSNHGGLISTVKEDRSACSDTGDTNSDTSEPREKRDQLKNPLWIEDKALRKGKVEYLPPNEIQFWQDLISQYLWPLDENQEEKKRIAQELAELRNQSVFIFFMCNALFILIVFLLQLNKDNIHVDWPLGVKYNITLIEETGQVLINKEYLQMEPIGLVFVFFFALILLIQFIAMLFHRFVTLSHILSSCELTSCCNTENKDTPEEMLRKNAVEIVKNMQRLRDDRAESYEGENRLARRRTIQNLVNQQQKRQPIGTLDVAFRKRFQQLSSQTAEATPILGNMRKMSMRADALRALEQRKNSVMQERRRKRMETLGAHNDFNKKPRHRSSNASGVSSLQGAFLQRNGHPAAARHNDGYENSSEDEELVLPTEP